MSTTPLKKFDNLSQHLADWVVATGYDDLGQAVVDATTSFVVDHFGVVLAGTQKASSQIIYETCKLWAPVDATSTQVGRSERSSAPFAALVNGTTGHALELDDDHREGTQHPGVAVIPAAFAMAEKLGKSGREFLLAAALGYEIMIRMGEAHLGKSYLRGFHPTGTCGTIGAAVAAGKLLGLNAEQMRSAIGLAASQSAGLLTFRSNGAWNKRLHAGQAAMSGVICAELAARDFRGPSESLLSPEGWLQAFAYNDEFDVHFIVDRLGQKWDLIENSIKVHACCRFAGPIVDATLETVFRENVLPGQVESVTVAMAKYPLTRSLIEPLERKLNPTSVVDAQFSAPFAAAVSIVKRRAFVEEYSETGIRDPEVLAMARKVRWEVDPEAERLWPKRYPCQVTIRLTDGRSVSSRVEWPKGDPENPVTEPELRAKFLTLATPVLGAEGAAASYAAISGVASADNLAGISAGLIKR
ncbi:MAG TPA: MmgE/PrpD family protein [Bordetella sp.]